MEVVVIWLAFAIVTALAANARGHSPGLWFCIGVLGGIFALIAVLVIKPGASATVADGNVPPSYSPHANAGPDGPVVATRKGIMIYQHRGHFWVLGQTFITLGDAERHADENGSA